MRNRFYSTDKGEFPKKTIFSIKKLRKKNYEEKKNMEKKIRRKKSQKIRLNFLISFCARIFNRVFQLNFPFDFADQIFHFDFRINFLNRYHLISVRKPP